MNRKTIQLPNLKPFEIWREGGIIKQSGIGELPEVLMEFADTTAGMHAAMGFMEGLEYAQNLLKEKQ